MILDSTNSVLNRSEIWRAKYIGDSLFVGLWKGGVHIFHNDDSLHIQSSDLGTKHNNISDFIIDKKNRVWIIDYSFTPSSVIVMHDNGKWVNKTPPTMFSSQVVIVNEDENGRLWFGTFGNGIFIYDVDSEQWSRINPDNSSMQAWSTRFIEFDERGNTWVGHYDYGYSVLKDGEWKNYRRHDEESVHSIHLGNDIWLGSEEGVFMHNSPNIRFNMANSPLPSNYIHQIEEDKFGRLWIGTDKGLTIKDESNWISFSNTSVLGSFPVRHINMTGNDEIWISTWGGGLIKIYNDLTGLRTDSKERIIYPYPNPFDSEISIFGINGQQAEYIVFDISSGQILISDKTSGDIDMSTVKSNRVGLMVNLNEVNYVFKLVKE